MTGTSPPDLSTRLEQYAGAKRRGVEWLLRQTHADGSIGDPVHGFRFYRVPWTFTVAGETAAATALCGWIRRHMFTPEGDFDRGRRVLTDAYAYRNATLVYGAHMARQFDLSSRGLEFVLTMQDPQSGGFTNDLEADGTPGDVMDIPYACGCGLACIALGRLDAARAVHAFLERIWRAQRELPDRLHYAWSRERQALVTGGADEPSWFTVEAQAARKQRWTVGGIAAAFLCRLHMVDPRSNYVIARARLHGLLDAMHAAAVRLRPGLQERLGRGAALSAHRGCRVRRLGGSSGRLVRRDATSGRLVVLGPKRNARRNHRIDR